MGPIKLDQRIMGTMKGWGNNYDSMTGCNHNGEADEKTSKITSKSITLNKEMDPNRAKPASMNPGKDMGFLGKAKPQQDTTGHGTLTRSCKD